MDIKKINIKEGEALEVKISEGTKVKIQRVDNKSTFVFIDHYDTSSLNKVKLTEYSEYTQSTKSKDSSWSSCDSKFENTDGTDLIVNHTAFNK